MFGILTSLAKASLGDITAPVAIAADVVTLGDTLTEKDEPYTAEAVKDIAQNLKNATDPERNLHMVRMLSLGKKKQIEDCPFCGKSPDMTNPDTLHQVGRENNLFVFNCTETGGGCGASVTGISAIESIQNWNKRT